MWLFIGANDLWIAAQALALEVTLVPDNVGEFKRIEGLVIENWLTERTAELPYGHSPNQRQSVVGRRTDCGGSSG